MTQPEEATTPPRKPKIAVNPILPFFKVGNEYLPVADLGDSALEQVDALKRYAAKAQMEVDAFVAVYGGAALQTKWPELKQLGARDAPADGSWKPDMVAVQKVIDGHDDLRERMAEAYAAFDGSSQKPSDAHTLAVAETHVMIALIGRSRTAGDGIFSQRDHDGAVARLAAIGSAPPDRPAADSRGPSAQVGTPLSPASRQDRPRVRDPEPASETLESRLRRETRHESSNEIDDRHRRTDDRDEQRILATIFQERHPNGRTLEQHRRRGHAR